MASPLPRPMHPSRHRPARPGFTLIEILTATAVMSVIVAMVLTIVTQVMNAWTRSSDNLAISGQARVVLDLVAQDLQGAIFRRTGAAKSATDEKGQPQWFCLEQETSDQTDGRQQSRLMFFASTTQREEEDLSGKQIYGDVCAIEYRVRYEPMFSTNPNGEKVFVLHRAAINARSTLNGFDAASTAVKDRVLGSLYLMDMWNSIDDKSNGKNSDDPQLPLFGATAPETAIAYNVAKFKVVYYRQSRDDPTSGSINESLPGQVNVQTGLPLNPNIGPQPFVKNRDPSQPGTVYYGGFRDNVFTTNDGVAASGGATTTYSTLPAYADVTITFLTEEGAAIYYSQRGEVGPWDDFLALHGQTFTQRVYFSNRPQ